MEEQYVNLENPLITLMNEVKEICLKNDIDVEIDFMGNNSLIKVNGFNLLFSNSYLTKEKQLYKVYLNEEEIIDLSFKMYFEQVGNNFDYNKPYYKFNSTAKVDKSSHFTNIKEIHVEFFMRWVNQKYMAINDNISLDSTKGVFNLN